MTDKMLHNIAKFIIAFTATLLIFWLTTLIIDYSNNRGELEFDMDTIAVTSYFQFSNSTLCLIDTVYVYTITDTTNVSIYSNTFVFHDTLYVYADIEAFSDTMYFEIDSMFNDSHTILMWYFY